MNAPEKRTDLWKEPGVTWYMTVCGVSLAGILLVLSQRRFGTATLLPILAALIASLTRFGPVVLAAALAISLNVPTRRPLVMSHGGVLDVPDLVLCALVLGYAVAHYRLQAIVGRIFPADPRRGSARDPARDQPFAGIRPAAPAREARPPARVTREEVAGLVWVFFWAALAQLLWRGLPAHGGGTDLEPPVWRALVLVWVIAAAGFAAAAYLGYLRWRRRPPDEALVFLQDTLWHETRREQCRLNRWLAWARLRRRR